MTIKTQAGFKAESLAVVIVRTPPEHPHFTQAGECIQALVKKGYALWVFVQGPAVGAWCLQPSWLAEFAHVPAVTIRLCQAAWRRWAGQQAPPYELSTLIQAWSQIMQADQVAMFGLGVWPDDWPEPVASAPPTSFGLMVSYAPQPEDRTSQLEWALAGSALDLDVIVAFAGSATQELEPSRYARWAQLADQQLARVIQDPASMPQDHRCWLVL